MAKRVVLFLLTNLAVIVVLGVVMSLLEATGVFAQLSFDWMPLLIFAAVIGFAGSFLSLAMSKTIAKWSTGARVIERPRTPTERWLLQTVTDLSRKVGIGRPEVAIYDSPEINAFATGMNRNDALVAVSTGLLHQMRPDEAEAVLGHEIAHVANGDMVTLSLIQGVVNTFVIFFSRVVGFAVDSFLRDDRDDDRGFGFGPGYWIATIACEIVFGILATMLVMWFSRRREFRADAGGARLAGREKMVAALQRLKAEYEPSHLPDSMAAFGIKGGRGGGLMALFRSHPPLDERIARLRSGI